MSFYLTKANGQTELFDSQKLDQSLRRSGADDQTRKAIIAHILEIKPDTTAKVYQYAMNALKQERIPGVAARYNLKQALMNLGPAGFPFEKYVAQLFKAQHYTITLNAIVQGKCISHEIDIIAQKDNHHFIVECKFHHQHGLRSDVKVVLYSKARFDDIMNAWQQAEKQNAKTHAFHEAWVITNTKFTTPAIQYGKCVGINLIGWSYPEKGNLPDMINELTLHPITALTSLNMRQKQTLLSNGIVLCRQVADDRRLLKQAGFSDRLIDRLLQEATAVCKI